MESENQRDFAYATEIADIPKGDRYADIPLYGRYGPKCDDFKPLTQHVNSSAPESLRYWEDVLSRLGDSNIVYKNELDEDGRDVFALGTLIIKSGHLHAAPTRDYSLNDANEVAAIDLARKPLGELDIAVPDIYFTGKLLGRDVIIQQRMPGVGMNIASQYLDIETMESFKKQARIALKALQDIEPPPGYLSRSYVVPAPDPVKNHRIRQEEADILFSERNGDDDLSLMHNDFTQSNCIVKDGKITALIDWEMAGFFGLKTAGKVHEEIRSPRRQGYAHLEGREEYVEILRKMFFWQDLYRID
ncbi:unnamed protein product [Clonostachys rosea]|uniref:Aminoglycoside phosphotransferase domain-containing protein n=1 Tax=Bionectria ochroleuca TaxID=29856 RepID=A0ABY6TS31_BIOOC|nr:unnamed protein product [Clonostachys rosea]